MNMKHLLDFELDGSWRQCPGWKTIFRRQSSKAFWDFKDMKNVGIFDCGKVLGLEIYSEMLLSLANSHVLMSSGQYIKTKMVIITTLRFLTWSKLTEVVERPLVFVCCGELDPNMSSRDSKKRPRCELFITGVKLYYMIIIMNHSKNWSSIPGNSCYWSSVCDQMFFCLEMHANEVKGSIQSRIDPFASFTCKTADNCDNSY